MATVGARSGPRAAVALLPPAPGVYRFRDAGGRVLYVGRAADLRRRAGSYWGALRDRRHLASMVARVARVEALVCDSEHEAAWVERNVLERSLPRWNRTPGGQEVPVYLRLDARRAAPGVRVVESVDAAPGVRHFGPYLGAQRARAAASALHRTLPLAYASDGLAGAARDMARALGVRPGDRAELAAAVAAVLERDAGAVAALRAELTRRREAAAALAFELAARLQAELESVDWVTAVQRATASDAGDLDLHGWADGVHVRLEIRAGRLCGWVQRPCREAAARPLVAATPAEWAPFACRNAELAARLSG